jgi:hypothetical protein
MDQIQPEWILLISESTSKTRSYTNQIFERKASSTNSPSVDRIKTLINWSFFWLVMFTWDCPGSNLNKTLAKCYMPNKEHMRSNKMIYSHLQGSIRL